MHLVVFTIEIYQDARSHERQTTLLSSYMCVSFDKNIRYILRVQKEGTQMYTSEWSHGLTLTKKRGL